MDVGPRSPDDICVVAVIKGPPQAKQRPRLGRAGNTYTPEETVNAEQVVGWTVREAGWRQGPDATSDFGVHGRFFTPTMRRRDGDNFLKLILDALNGIVWKDDSQVIEMVVQVIRGAEQPHTELTIYRKSLIP